MYNWERAMYFHCTNLRDQGWDNQSAAMEPMEDYSWGGQGLNWVIIPEMKNKNMQYSLVSASALIVSALFTKEYYCNKLNILHDTV